jgi:cell division protein FtsB
MSAAGSYRLVNMPRPAEPSPPPDVELDTDDASPEDVAAAVAPDLTGLTVAGLTRRRAVFLAAAFVAAWIVILFARQVGQASEATQRLRDLDAGNQALTGRVASLQRELQLIQRQEYILQVARGFGLGRGREIPFTLKPGTAPVPANAPGSASLRLGAADDSQSPLESWLSLLFGPSR